MVMSAKSPVICGIVTEMQTISVINSLFSGTKKRKNEYLSQQNPLLLMGCLVSIKIRINKYVGVKKMSYY